MKTWIDKSYWLPVQKYRGREQHVEFPCYVSLKLDGELTYLIVKNGRAVTVNKPKYGRWRTDYPVTQFAASLLPDGIYLGELYWNFGKTKEDFYSLLRHKYDDRLKLAIFGVLSYKGKEDLTTEDTLDILQILKKVLRFPFLHVIRLWVPQNKEELIRIAQGILMQGWEGLVVRNPGAIWQEGNSVNWIKIKKKERELMGSYGWAF